MTKEAKVIVGCVGLAVSVLGYFFYRNFLDPSARYSTTPVIPPFAYTPPTTTAARAETSAFTRFLSLDAFVGVECYLTSVGEKYPITNEAAESQLEYMTKVVVSKVSRGDVDPFHPESKGVKLYFHKIGEPNVTYVLHPRLGEKETFLNLPLTPVADLTLAKSMWEKKNLTLKVTKIADIEVEDGSRVFVTDVYPSGYFLFLPTFEANYRLPTGVNKAFVITEEMVKP